MRNIDRRNLFSLCSTSSVVRPYAVAARLHEISREKEIKLKNFPEVAFVNNRRRNRLSAARFISSERFCDYTVIDLLKVNVRKRALRQIYDTQKSQLCAERKPFRIIYYPFGW